MALRVGHGPHISINRFHEQLRTIAAKDGEEWILCRLLKCHLKSKPRFVELDGSFDIADDEEW
jgi:hypothetical protein